MHFRRIDQLRGLAALAVVVCHLAVSAYRGAPNAGVEPLPWLGLVLGFGYLGVPLFFVISGFCIHLPQAQALAARRPGAGRPGWGRFFKRRLLRLYPPYLGAIGLAAALLLLATGRLPVGGLAILAQALLVHTFHPTTFDGLNPPAWTLAVEAQLYLAYPVALALVVKYRPWRALAVVLATTMLYRVFLNFEPLPPTYGGVAWELFLARWFEWVLGAVVAAWAVGDVSLPRALLSPWLAAATLALAVSLEWHAWHYGLYVLKEPLYGVAFALVVVVALERERRRPAPARDAPAGAAASIATSRVGRYLGGVGLYSYSLYLVHRPIQLAFEPLVRRVAAEPFVVRHAIPSSLLLMAATTPVVLAAARLFYRWCEAPCIALAQRAGRAPERAVAEEPRALSRAG